MKYGTPFAKNKVFLPPKIYWKDVILMHILRLKKHLGSQLLRVLLSML